jgi:hypothetical protein
MLTNNQFKKRFPKLFVFLNEIGYRNWKDYVEDIGYFEDEDPIDENYAIECLTEEYENMMEWSNTIKPTSLIKGSRASEIDNKPKPSSNYN